MMYTLYMYLMYTVCVCMCVCVCTATIFSNILNLVAECVC